MTFLHNTWYQAGWSDEIDDGVVLSRTLLGRPVLLFRDAEGRATALLDRCPHRFAPLSAGKLEDGVIACGYHGLAFDGAGRCVRNPYGPVLKSMRVERYPVVERHSILWFWAGEEHLADPDAVPDLSFIDRTPSTAVIRGLMPTRADYRLLIDNIMDLSHADYLHPATLGGIFTDARIAVEQRDDAIKVEYLAENCVPTAGFQIFVPPPQRADIRIGVRWQAPGVMVLAGSVGPTGTPPDQLAESLTLHNMTPETATTTHYFYCSTRPYQTEDVALTAALKEVLEQAFVGEDKPMLELQQQRIGTADFWTLKPLLLSGDSAAVQVRRKLEQLIQAEAVSR